MPHDDDSPWENIKVATRCNVNYREMTGSGRVRNCARCQLNVYDLSGLSQQAAEQLLVETEGSLCNRFYRRNDGTILTSDCLDGLKVPGSDKNSAGLLEILFGPSKERIWQELSREINALYVKGSFWGTDQVVARHESWEIVLDNYYARDVQYTQMRALYSNRDHFRFKIWRRGFFSDMGVLFGMQDIQVGHAQFDNDYIIQANDESKVRALLDNERIRLLIEAQPEILLSSGHVSDWYVTLPYGVDELHFCYAGVITDKQRLRDLFDLFSEVLDQLCRMGSAQNEPPGVTFSEL